MKVSGLDVHKSSVFCGIFDGKKQQEVKEWLWLAISYFNALSEMDFDL